MALCSLVFSMALMSCKTSAPITSGGIVETIKMRKQADAFLRHTPAGLQHYQVLAIREAIDGDNASLMAVRNSRNGQPPISDNVETRMLRDSLRLYEPKCCKDNVLPLLIYLHGGGWTFGSINSCGRFCDAMASTGKLKVMALNYRLAPEHPFPEGLEDCIRAVEYAIENAQLLGIDAKRITIGGDSSGGNLAIAAALSGRCKGKIESLILFYPVVKAFDDKSESWKLYGKGYGLDAEIMEAFNKAYTQKADARNDSISVGLCSDEKLNRLPRTLLVAAGRDILRDQGKEFARRMGNKATRIEYKDAVHLFITVAGQDEAFCKAVNHATAFITQ